MTELFLTLTFLAAALGIVAGYFMCVDLTQRDELRASKRVEELRKDAKAAEAPPLFGSASEIDLGEFAPQAPPKADRPGLSGLLRRELARPLRGWVAHAGLTVRPAQLVAAAGVLALGLGLAGQLTQGSLLGVPGVIVGAAAPFVWVEARRRARKERFLAQLPGAFDLMAR